MSVLAHSYRDVFMNFHNIINFPYPNNMSFTRIFVLLGAPFFVAKVLRDPVGKICVIQTDWFSFGRGSSWCRGVWSLYNTKLGTKVDTYLGDPPRALEGARANGGS